MILLSILSVIMHLICGNNLNWLLNLNLIYETLWTGVKMVLLISVLGKLKWFFLAGLIAMVLLIWKCMGFVLEEKSSWCWGWPPVLNWIGACALSLFITKTASKKLELCALKFLSPEVTLYLYKSTICSWMEYCCHDWVGAPNCYLKLLDKLQKQTCRTVGPSFATFLEPLAHHQDVDSLSFFYIYIITLVDILQNWLKWFHFFFLKGGLLVILKDCIFFCHHS